MSIIKLVSLKAVSRTTGCNLEYLKRLYEQHDLFVKPIKFHKLEKCHMRLVELVPLEAIEYLSKLTELLDTRGMSIGKASRILKERTEQLRRLMLYAERI